MESDARSCQRGSAAGAARRPQRDRACLPPSGASFSLPPRGRGAGRGPSRPDRRLRPRPRLSRDLDRADAALAGDASRPGIRRQDLRRSRLDARSRRGGAGRSRLAGQEHQPARLRRRLLRSGALVKPGVLDNQRCISFWTIEHRGVIPRDIRPLIGDWIFGCDLCQEICPVNARPAAPDAAALTAFGPMMESRPRLDELLTLDDESFRARFRQSAVWRTRRSGLLRNVCIALGNVADRRSVPALAAALADDQPLIRGHAAWALGRLGGAAARNALALALRREADSWVRDECQLAIEECGPLAVPLAGVPPSPLPPAPA
ncbi:MAG: hypothetical protein E6I68_01815 [Chloroflexi bacterium]|nr:MAG: hypothetical protein E6I68_01815 [Chloroflexota bacterium]